MPNAAGWLHMVGPAAVGSTALTGSGSALEGDARARLPAEFPRNVLSPLSWIPLWGAGRVFPCPQALGYPGLSPARPSAPDSRTGKHRELGAGYPRWCWLGFIYQLGGKGQERVAVEEPRLSLV